MADSASRKFSGVICPTRLAEKKIQLVAISAACLNVGESFNDDGSERLR